MASNISVCWYRGPASQDPGGSMNFRSANFRSARFHALVLDHRGKNRRRRPWDRYATCSSSHFCWPALCQAHGLKIESPAAVRQPLRTPCSPARKGSARNGPTSSESTIAMCRLTSGAPSRGPVPAPARRRADSTRATITAVRPRRGPQRRAGPCGSLRARRHSTSGIRG
jgi:hypothetical protein